MNNYFYILAASLFVIGQITFVNNLEGISDPPIQVFSFDDSVSEAVDVNELVLSYVFGESENIDEELINAPLTLGQAQNIISRAYFDKYNSEFIIDSTDVSLESVVSREAFATMFYNLCADEPFINECQYITDVKQNSEAFEKISTLYKVGIISGNSSYGHFIGDSEITPKVAKVMISRLKNPEQRVLFSPAVQNPSHALDYICVKQTPELPTGCEVTSLTSVLNYYGFNVDKLTMADVYLEKGAIGQTDPSVAFIGSPYQSSSYGCYAPVIEKCADKFLMDNSSELSSYRLSGVAFKNLLTEVEQGYPVIIWASIGMRQTYNSSVWTIGDKQVTWIANEHCLVLYGYDLDRNVVFVADPLVGNVEYDIDLFETRYNELLQQAIVIK